MHGGAAGSGAPEGNGNAQKHGLTADETLLYQRLDAEMQAQVDKLRDDIVADIADARGISPDAVPSYLVMSARRVAMNMVRVIHFTEDWEAKSAASNTDSPLVDENVVAVTPDGHKVYQNTESVVQSCAARLSRENRQWLKDMGILDTPRDKEATRMGQTLVGALAEAMQSQASEQNPDSSDASTEDGASDPE